MNTSSSISTPQDTDRTEKLPSFTRSVSQLLFTYLPERTIDWEDGAVVVRLNRVRLSNVWSPERSTRVLKDVDEYLARWVKNGGRVKSPLPTRGDVNHFIVGEPHSVSARFFHAALICTNCQRLLFPSETDMVKMADKDTLKICPECGKPTLRQFPWVLVHGCGRLDPITRFLPSMDRDGDRFVITRRPIKCPNCGGKERLFLPARSERVRDLRIYCKNCGFDLGIRLVGRCEDCIKGLESASAAINSSVATEDGVNEPTAVAKVAMRLTRYNASDAYYPHTITFLRTDLSRRNEHERNTARELTALIQTKQKSNPQYLQQLITEMQEAVARGDMKTVQRLTDQIRDLAGEPGGCSKVVVDPMVELNDEMQQAVSEAIAFDSIVRATPALEVARRNTSIPEDILKKQANTLSRLGIAELSLVDGLPIITASFGYSRRSPDPTYEEDVAGRRQLPTTIRPFPSLDRNAARALNRPDLWGRTPIMAREAEHQGLFFALDAERVVRWLNENNVNLANSGQPPLVRILSSLEAVDRYYDGIWTCTVRRLVFGVVHTLSHAFMRAIAPYAGLERTSISEYILLPLLGAVVYDNSSAVNLGAIETAIQNNLPAILESLQTDAVSCIYDVDCIDRGKGACHGCIHSPEICCRVFNHGLSRAFLLGGHAPWAAPEDQEFIRGYWTVSSS